MSSDLRLRVLGGLSAIAPEAWNALVGPRGGPFLSWELLEALESTGCVGASRGWLPQHITLWRGDTLVGALPAYLKADSNGDFSRDWGFAEFAGRHGIPFYPKLIVAVPFTPVVGQRILLDASVPREAGVAALLAGARAVAEEHSAGAIQVLYCLPEEAAELDAQGMTSRVLFQFHWHNQGYADVDAWLAQLTSKRRTATKREMAEPQKQGISITTLRGDALRADPEGLGDTAYALYRTTTDKYTWGGAYLTREFFRTAFARLPDSAELVQAHLGPLLVAGAINFSSADRLFGRYWGCHQEHKFLHFNVCLYHSIGDCIARGLTVFEGGAGGEHKLLRDFAPTFVHSAHEFRDPRIAQALSRYLSKEAQERAQELALWKEKHAR